MSNDTMTMSLMRGCNGFVRCTRGALAAANLVVRLLVAEEPSEYRAAYDALPARLHESETLATRYGQPPRRTRALRVSETSHTTWEILD